MTQYFRMNRCAITFILIVGLLAENSLLIKMADKGSEVAGAERSKEESNRQEHKKYVKDSVKLICKVSGF